MTPPQVNPLEDVALDVMKLKLGWLVDDSVRYHYGQVSVAAEDANAQEETCFLQSLAKIQNEVLVMSVVLSVVSTATWWP